jgi:hypothetical protein
VQILKWWTNDPTCNIGISTENLLVLDPDMKNGKNGFKVLDEWVKQYGELPKTAITRTPNKGKHIIYKLPPDVRVTGGVNKLGHGLDVLAAGNLIVAPGSTIDGVAYEWETHILPSFAPDWLIERCGRAKHRGEAAKIERKPREQLRALPWVNQTALDRIKDWAPDAFPGGRWASQGAWRVGPDATCRGCEEDLAIHPRGIEDFGGETKYTATRLIAAFFDKIEDGELVEPADDHDDHWNPLGKLSEDEARDWLCDRLDLDWNKLVEEDRATDLLWLQQVEEQEPPPGAALSLKDWLARHLPEPEYISGRWLTTTSRVLVVGPTGLGKSMLLVALGMAIAAGRGFLHWAQARPARVLYIDGEMSSRLLKRRLADEVRRLDVVPDNFYALSHEDIPNFQPLNTPAGRAAIEAYIKRIGGVDLLIFDNVMSLIGGDQKDEEGWSLVMPWIRALTARSIGQIWVHHTGHDESRSYGTTTREWQLDTVAHMTRVNRPDTDVAFELEFKKARERSPETRADFDPVQVALVMDEWQVDRTARGVRGGKPWPQGLRIVHQCIVEALKTSGGLHQPNAECPPVQAVEVGIARDLHQKRYLGDGKGDRDTAERKTWSRNLMKARADGLIQSEGQPDGRELVWLSE